jgi:hypothetical protein
VSTGEGKRWKCLSGEGKRRIYIYIHGKSTFSFSREFIHSCIYVNIQKVVDGRGREKRGFPVNLFLLP